MDGCKGPVVDTIAEGFNSDLGKGERNMTQGFTRRDFLKAGGAVGVAGVAASTLGIGSVLTGCSSDASANAVTLTEFVYTCPICGKKAADYNSLVKHFKEHHPNAAVPQAIALNINGIDIEVQTEPQWTLRETLLKAVGLTGNAKEMCDRGGCGSCTVLIDGVPALACTTLAASCVGKKIETAEGIAADPDYQPLVEEYAKQDAMQCGYCTPGQFTVAKYIVTKYEEPTEEQIRYELSGNICRCGTYSRHVIAIQNAAAEMRSVAGKGGSD